MLPFTSESLARLRAPKLAELATMETQEPTLAQLAQLDVLPALWITAMSSPAQLVTLSQECNTTSATPLAFLYAPLELIRALTL